MNTMHETRHTARQTSEMRGEGNGDEKHILVLHVQIIFSRAHGFRHLDFVSDGLKTKKKWLKFYRIVAFSSTYHVSLCLRFFDVI